MIEHGFVRVAAAVPLVRVADCAYHVHRLANLLKRAQAQDIHIIAFPELCVTGYTCGDLFHQPTLQKAALTALADLTQKSLTLFRGLFLVGLPLVVDDLLYNCAALIQRGRILGIVPKSYLPNYKEFYEARWFAPGTQARTQTLRLVDQDIPFGTDLLFDASAQMPGLVVGVEICEDLWVPIPPSSRQALAGATLLVNLSASNEVIGKSSYRRQLVVNQSGRCAAGYLYVSCGVHESTTDVVFGGHCLVAENGALLAESPRFRRDETLLCTDIDVQRLQNERQKTNSFGASQALLAERNCRRIAFELNVDAAPRRLVRPIDAHPFVPRGQEQLRERCQEIFHTQTAGLAKRLEHTGSARITLGVSGGLDSTLALLVACKTLDLLQWPRSRLLALTMPGFGTTKRTKNNAVALMRLLGVAMGEIDIRQLCLDEFLALGHKPFGIELAGLSLEDVTRRLQEIAPEKCHDLVFENVQARMRTSLLMNQGFVIGTGDLSELALGWCTYNADHMSMYNPNVSIPKTLVKFLVRWAAENEFEGEAAKTLVDILGTVISPELLPPGADGQIQATEDAIGPYELHDFFLFHFLRYGAPPEKILFLAEQAAFDKSYTTSDLRRWLKVFVERFFANQFKRSCLPDGPKVGTISLSPRGDWRMPSDAQATAWLSWAGRE
ncbi:MAG: NAD(+) synthase [Gemmataceae bacterium]|nr:NAD(+) synthase [Gemmataceae bacterium]